MRVNSDWI